MTGRLEYREWEDNEGSRHSIHEVVANQVEFLSAPPKDAAGGRGDEPTYDYGEEPF